MQNIILIMFFLNIVYGYVYIYTEDWKDIYQNLYSGFCSLSFVCVCVFPFLIFF